MLPKSHLISEDAFLAGWRKGSERLRPGTNLAASARSIEVPGPKPLVPASDAAIGTGDLPSVRGHCNCPEEGRGGTYDPDSWHSLDHLDATVGIQGSSSLEATPSWDLPDLDLPVLRIPLVFALVDLMESRTIPVSTNRFRPKRVPAIAQELVGIGLRVQRRM